MACAFEQQADGGLDRRIVIHDQYSCQNTVLRVPTEIRQRRVVNFAENPVLCNGLSGADVPPVAARHYSKSTISAGCRVDALKNARDANAICGAAGNPPRSVAQIFRIPRANPGEFAERAR